MVEIFLSDLGTQISDLGSQRTDLLSKS